jgi:hypothetical protein
MTKPMYKIDSIVTIEFNDGRKMQVTLTDRHYNVIYCEWVYFAKELKRNILESNIF